MRDPCQSDKLSIVVLKNCLAILHRLVLTIYALLKMSSLNFQCFSDSIVPRVSKTNSSTLRSMISIGVVLSRPWVLAGGRTCGTQGATTSRTLFLLCALLSNTVRRRDMVFSQVAQCTISSTLGRTCVFRCLCIVSWRYGLVLYCVPHSACTVFCELCFVVLLGG